MALAVGAWGQTQPVTQTVAATAVCVSIRTQNNSTVGIITSGTWSGTFTPNVQISTVSGAPTVAKKVVPVDSTTAQATVTTNNGFRADVSGFAVFNFCSTGTWTSGTATVTLNVTPQAAASTVAGSSGGTVTNVATGTGLTGGPITTTGTISLSTPVSAANGGTGVANTANLTLGTSSVNLATLGTGIVKNTIATGLLTDAASADVIALFSGTCSGSTYLSGSGACSSPGGAISSVSNSDGTLTISPTTGAVVASLALGNANTWTGAQTGSGFNTLFASPPTIGGTAPGIVNATASNSTIVPTKVEGLTPSSATGALPQPVQMGWVSCTQGTCATSATNLVASATNTMYLGQVYAVCTTTTSTATATGEITYTDPGGISHNIAPGAAAICTTLGASSFGQATATFVAQSGSAITYQASTANAPAGYQLRVSVMQVGTN
jgi:hypothetical protein